MGMSPEGIVFYGYHFDEGELEDGAPDLDDIAAARATAKGAKKPDYRGWPSSWGPERDAWYAEHRPEITAWHEATQAEQKAMGVEWRTAGSYDYGTHFVAIPASYHFAEWSEMVELPQLFDEDGWEDILNAHLEDMGIEKPQEHPRWYLTAFYG